LSFASLGRSCDGINKRRLGHPATRGGISAGQHRCARWPLSHEFGNGTSIYTGNGDAARKYSLSMHGGMVSINIPIPVPVAFHSFGGWKRSVSR
jgi:hypothetical protein